MGSCQTSRYASDVYDVPFRGSIDLSGKEAKDAQQRRKTIIDISNGEEKRNYNDKTHQKKQTTYTDQRLKSKTIKRYLPHHLLNTINNRSNKIAEGQTEFVTRKEGVVLFIDLKGFTKLTETLVQNEKGNNEGAEKLTIIINEFFTHLISCIDRFNGDIDKFAGDAIITCFYTDEKHNKKNTHLGAALHQAMSCAATLVKKYGNYKIHDRELSFHMAISGGTLYDVHIGGVNNKWKRLLLGQPMIDLGSAMDAATEKNHVVLSKQLVHLIDAKTLVQNKAGSDGDVLLDLNAVRKTTMTSALPDAAQALASAIAPVDEMTSDGLMEIVPDETTSKRTERIITAQDFNNLSLYLEDDMLASIEAGTEIIAQLKEIATLFIHVPFKEKQNVTRQAAEYHALMKDIQSVCYRYEGGFSNVLADEKGMHVLINFGYPYQHEDVHYRAVKAALELQESTQIKCYIGITYGAAYCGPVGSQSRADLTTMGDKINLSARLAVLAKTNGHSIVVEHEHFNDITSNLIEYDTTQPPVSLKGKTQKIAYMLPLHVKKPTTILGTTNFFVGRESELKVLGTALKNKTTSMINIIGEPGLGKSALIKKYIADEKIDAIIIQNDSTERNTQFLTWNKIMNELMAVCGTGDASLDTLINTALATDMKIYGSLVNVIFNTTYKENKRTRNLGAAKRVAFLYTIIQRIVAKLVEGRDTPIVLVIDSFQWTDEQSISLFEHALNEPLGGVKFIIGGRTEKTLDIAEAPKDTAVLIELTALNIDQTAAILKSLVPDAQNIEKNIISYVHKTSSGNPYLTIELFDLLRNNPSQVFRLIAGELQFTDTFFAQLDTFAPPQKRSDYILSKIDRLPAVAKHVLKLSSIFQEQSVPMKQLCWMCTHSGNLSEEQFYAAMDTLMKFKHFCSVRSTKEKAVYRFSDVPVLAYQQLPKQLKQRYHFELGSHYDKLLTNASSDDEKCEYLEATARHYIGFIKNHIDGTTASLRLDKEQGKHMISRIQECINVHKQTFNYKRVVDEAKWALAILDLMQSTLTIEPSYISQISLDLHLSIAVCLFHVFSPSFAEEIVSHYEACLPLILRNQYEIRFKILWGLWFQDFSYGVGTRNHMDLARELLALAWNLKRKASQENEERLLQAHRSMALSLYQTSNFKHINNHIDKGMKIYEANKEFIQQSDNYGGSDPGMHLLVIASRINWLFGQYPNSTNYADNAFLTHETIDDTYSKVLYYSYSCYNEAISGNMKRLKKIADIAVNFHEQKSLHQHRLYRYEAHIYSDFAAAKLSPQQMSSFADSMRKNMGAVCSINGGSPFILQLLMSDIEITMMESPEAAIDLKIVKKMDEDLSLAADEAEVALSPEFYRLLARTRLLIPLPKNELEKLKAISRIEEAIYASLEIARVENAFSFMLRTCLFLVDTWKNLGVWKSKKQDAIKLTETIQDHISEHGIDKAILDALDNDNFDDVPYEKDIDSLRNFTEIYTSLKGVSARDNEILLKQERRKFSFFGLGFPQRLFERQAAKENKTLVPLALKTGDKAPNFKVKPYGQEETDLYTLMKKGPVVLNFFRGSWCPFCTAEMCSLDENWSRIHALGAEIVSISSHEKAPSTFIQRKIKMAIATDDDFSIGKAFRIVQEQKFNRKKFPRLHFPATYVVGTDGIITFHFVDARFWLRESTDNILAHLQELKRNEILKKKRKQGSAARF